MARPEAIARRATPPTCDPLGIHRSSEPAPADGWPVPEWDAGRSSITDWMPGNVRTAADGATEVVLGRAPAGFSDPFAGGEMRSSATVTTGTFGWTAQGP